MGTPAMARTAAGFPAIRRPLAASPSQRIRDYGPGNDGATDYSDGDTDDGPDEEGGTDYDGGNDRGDDDGDDDG